MTLNSAFESNSQVSFHLDRKTESSIKELFSLFSKDDTIIKLSEVAFLFLEKNLLCNKFTFDELSQQFFKQTGGECEMRFPQFVSMFQNISKQIFSEMINPLEALLQACMNEKARFKNWKGELISRIQDILP